MPSSTSIALGAAIYFVTWWIVLFAVLPWGVKSQEEDGDISPGSEPGAPTRPMLLRKMLITTVVATVIFGIAYEAWISGLDAYVFPAGVLGPR